jgi:hypothetical protein
MTQQHTITPPQWQMDAWQARIETMGADVPAILLEVAQWGADQELEACLGEVSFLHSQALADRVREKRRRQPPSLKEKALKGLANMVERGHLASDLAADLRALLEQFDGE